MVARPWRQRELGTRLGTLCTSALVLAAVLAPRSEARPQSDANDVVGIFELGAPQVSPFVLHGTLPVPKKTFPQSNGKSPFSVLDWNGTLVPAQVEAVSYYTDQQHDGADVVEIVARVSLPPGTAKDTRVQYKIVDDKHQQAPIALTSPVQQLVNTPGSVQIRARDCFGNLYSSDLLRGQDGVVTLRNGQHAVQKRNYEMMRPQGGTQGPPTGPLPHLMGVHSYVTTWGNENFVSIDLRVNNGSSGLDKNDPIDNPQASLYFDSLEIRVPTGWTVLSDWRDPFIAAPIPQGAFSVVPIVKPNADGTLHMMPQQSQFQRRIAITRLGNEQNARTALNQEGLGFCRRGQSPTGPADLYSWWNPLTARYFPQRHRIPELDHITQQSSRVMLTNDLEKIRIPLITGGLNTGPIFSNVLGWAHPWGVKYGGMTSGSEIYMYDGLVTADCASRDGYRLSELALRLYMERHPVALYNKDGNFTQVNQWVIHGPPFDYVPMQFFLKLLGGNDPFGFNVAPQYQVQYVQQHNLQPAYEATLIDYDPIDLQHQIRLTRNAKVLTWLGNDALAKDELRAQAELVRLSYHEYYTSAAGGKVPTSLLADQLDVANSPGIGFQFGRGEGWDIDTVNAAYSVADPAWRTLVRPWYDKIVNVVRDGQSDCTGIIERLLSDKVLLGLFHARKATEQAIIENALWGMLQSVYLDVDPARVTTMRDIMTKSAYSLINAPSWSTTHKGPWEGLAVSPQDPQLPPFCSAPIPPGGTSSSIDAYQCWSSFGYGYELTGDNLFLSRAFDLTHDTTSLYDSLKANKWDNLENTAALFAVVIAINNP